MKSQWLSLQLSAPASKQAEENANHMHHILPSRLGSVSLLLVDKQYLFVQVALYTFSFRFSVTK